MTNSNTVTIPAVLPDTSRRYWLMRIAPSALLKTLFRKDGIYFWKSRVKGLPLDPETQVYRAGYDADSDTFVLVLAGANGYVVPEGSPFPRIDPNFSLITLDYESLEQLEELLTDPDLGVGLKEWATALMSDMLDMGKL